MDYFVSQLVTAPLLVINKHTLGYKEARRQAGADFFQAQAVDPCRLTVTVRGFQGQPSGRAAQLGCAKAKEIIFPPACRFPLDLYGVKGPSCSAASAPTCTGAIIGLQAPERKSSITLLESAFTAARLITGLRINLGTGLITQLGALLLPALVSRPFLM